jgi:hypothetical protein
LNAGSEHPGLVEAVLALAFDELPLWDILHEIRAREPGKTETEQQVLAVQAINDLLTRGLVELVRTRSDAPWYRVAGAGETQAILSNPNNWRSTGHGEQNYVELHAVVGENRPPR